MLRRRRELHIQSLQVLDAFLVSACLWIAHFLRVQVVPLLPGGERLPAISAFEEFAWMWLIVMPLTPLLLESAGFYRFTWLPRTGAAIRAMLGLLLALALALTFLRIHLSRGVLVIMTLLSIAALMLRDRLVKAWHLRAAANADNAESLIIAAAPGGHAALAQSIRAQPDGARARILEFDLLNQPVDALVRLLHDANADRVVVRAGNVPFDRAAECIRACEIEGVEVWVPADFFQTSIARPAFDDFLGTPTLVIRSAPNVSWQLMAKSFLDRAGAAILLVLFAPAMLLIAAAIRLTSPGPALFRQTRGGRHGRPFIMLKFRSMTSDAEMLKSELMAFNQMAGPVFKLDADPRVTPLGKFLRRTSLDELPQLWNVLRGEMSLVGPRPLPIEEVERFPDLAHRRRLSMKPGITGLWQVSGRNQISNFNDWVRLDLEYIDRWSLGLDLKILLLTLPAVVTGRGAT